MDRDEPGYWIGSYTVNLFVTEAVFAVAFGGGLLVFWPDVPWATLTVVCAALAVIVPVLVFPHSKLLYLAIDLAFRPLDPADLETPTEKPIARSQ